MTDMIVGCLERSIDYVCLRESSTWLRMNAAFCLQSEVIDAAEKGGVLRYRCFWRYLPVLSG